MTNEIELKESMSEKEIVTYLKDNKTNGVVYDFMPPDVRRWCEKHHEEFIFHCYYSCIWHGNSAIGNGNYVYSLPDDYEVKQEFKAHFVEFDIDENGYFYYEGKQYYYRDDVAFEKRHSDTFKGFGGWLYKCINGPMWVTIPHIAREGHLYMYMRLNENQNEITAPIPTKIRFWRYQE